MKKNILLVSAVAVLGMSSCSNEVNEGNFVDKTDAITFAAYPTKSRAVGADITSDNMKGDNFGVAGYSNNALYLYSSTDKGTEQKYVGSSDSWEYANMTDLKFWPDNAMDFYAYFPYSDNATFANSNATPGDVVMTIPNVDCTHDVLFAFAGSQSKQTRVPLTFHHAFAKIKSLQIEMPAEGSVYQSGCQVEVSNVEFVSTKTKGDVRVNDAGVASYNVAAANTTLAEAISPAVKVNNTSATGTLIDNGTSAKGYFFATNGAAVNNVVGVNSTMWDGDKASIGGKLSESNLVYLKLTCKVWNGEDSNKAYYVGGDSSYGELYIPLKGTDALSNPVSTFDAGKRYIYNIVMKDNVGFTDEGDPILTPILFSVDSVDDWTDVTVTITL